MFFRNTPSLHKFLNSLKNVVLPFKHPVFWNLSKFTLQKCCRLFINVIWTLLQPVFYSGISKRIRFEVKYRLWPKRERILGPSPNTLFRNSQIPCVSPMIMKISSFRLYSNQYPKMIFIKSVMSARNKCSTVNFILGWTSYWHSRLIVPAMVIFVFFHHRGSSLIHIPFASFQFFIRLKTHSGRWSRKPWLRCLSQAAWLSPVSQWNPRQENLWRYVNRPIPSIFLFMWWINIENLPRQDKQGYCRSNPLYFQLIARKQKLCNCLG